MKSTDSDKQRHGRDGKGNDSGEPALALVACCSAVKFVVHLMYDL